MVKENLLMGREIEETKLKRIGPGRGEGET